MSETEFTTDWRDSIVHWPDLFAELDLVGKPGLWFLEVGCFEGRTTRWLLENVLTDPTSQIVVVDPFTASYGQATRFSRNTRPWIHRIHRIQGRSYDALPPLAPAFGFDFIYVDGAHDAASVLSDAVLSWRVLKPGGTMVFDDYDWPGQAELDQPKIAVDAFVACYAREIADHRRIGRDQYLVRRPS